MSVFLFSLGKLMAAKYHVLCAKISHERYLWKSRSRERQWSTWRLLLTSWLSLRTVCSWVINISDKLTFSIFYAEEGGTQVSPKHRQMSTIIYGHFDTWKWNLWVVETSDTNHSLMQRRVTEGRRPLVRCWEIPHIAPNSMLQKFCWYRI
jgi:hypothetical protein